MRVAWVAGWVAGLADNDDGVSSLARLEAADEGMGDCSNPAKYKEAA